MRNRFFLLLLLLLPTFASGQSAAVLDGAYVSNVFSSSNFIKNPNCQRNTANISTTAGSTITRSTTTPLMAGTECNIADAGAWDAIWTTRTVDAGMSNRLCEVGMTVRGAAGGTTTLAVLDGAATVFTQSVTLDASNPRRIGGTFPCGSTLSAFTVTLSGTSAITQTIEAGNVYLGRAVSVSSGTISTEWQSYTPTVNNLGAGSGTVAAKYRRVGDSVELEATFSKDATPGSGASAVWFSLPSGLTADTAKIASGSNGHYGTAFTNDTTAAASALSSLYQNSVGGIAISCGTASCTGASYTANSLWRFKISVPIVGWQATDIVNPEVNGPYFTDWTSYTTTVSNLGAGSGTAAAKYRRVADTAEIEITFTKDATPGSGASAVWFSLPSGLTADTAKIASGTNGHYGTAYTNDATSAASALSSLYQNSVGGLAFSCGTSSCTGASFTANSVWRLKIGVPIVGWTSPYGSQSFYMQGPVKAAVNGTPIPAEYMGNLVASGSASGDPTGDNVTKSVTTVTLGAGTYRLHARGSLIKNTGTTVTQGANNTFNLTVTSGSATVNGIDDAILSQSNPAGLLDGASYLLGYLDTNIIVTSSVTLSLNATARYSGTAPTASYKYLVTRVN